MIIRAVNRVDPFGRLDESVLERSSVQNANGHGWTREIKSVGREGEKLKIITIRIFFF